MKMLVKVYDKSKYERDSKVVCENEYNNVLAYEILSGKQFDVNHYDDIDENDEYLRLHFIDGTTATFRNSHIDLFRI